MAAASVAPFAPAAVTFDTAPAVPAAPVQETPSIRFGTQPGRFALETLAQKAWVGDWLASRENSSVTRQVNNWKVSLGPNKGISRL